MRPDGKPVRPRAHAGGRGDWVTYFLMTNDVECFSFEHNQYRPEVAKRVLHQGLPRLLDLYDKHDVNATFFFTGDIVELEPEVVDIVKARGKHEVGCHGWSHESENAYDVLPLDKQVATMQKAKSVIEKANKNPIISFRAPAARINSDTIVALEKTGFLVDSSVCSQRFDGPMTFGAKNKVNWLFTPRLPYHPSRKDPYTHGDSPILEIPISAFLLGFTGTSMRAINPINNMLQRFLARESRKSNKPLVFIVHPNEAMDVDLDAVQHQQRGRTMIQKVFADKLRHRIKLHNLGKHAVSLLEEVILTAKKNEISFISCKDYLEIHKRTAHGNNR